MSAENPESGYAGELRRYGIACRKENPMNLPDALAAVAAMDAERDALKAMRNFTPDECRIQLDRIYELRRDAGLACIAYVRTIAAQQGSAVAWLPADIDFNFPNLTYRHGYNDALELCRQEVATHPQSTLSAEEVNAVESLEKHFRDHYSARLVCNALRRLTSVRAKPVEGDLVRYINIYPSNLCTTGQEEFVHSTYEQAQRHINPGGQTIKFTTNPSVAAVQVDERSAAEQAYTLSAFDYVRDPVGSERWCQYWNGWQARAAVQVGDATMRAALTEPRRWISDGLGDGMHQSIWTPHYAAAVDLVDAALAHKGNVVQANKCPDCGCKLARNFGGLEEHKSDCPRFPL